jgi:hypothetical protein
MFKGHAGKHGHVEEHLKSELAGGWWIVSTPAFGGSADGHTARGWFAVVLEKNE